MTTEKKRPKGKFFPKEDFVVAERFMQFKVGQDLPRCSWSKMRVWWRRGMIEYKDPEAVAKKYEQKAQKAKEPEKAEGETAGEAPVEQDGVEDEPMIETVTAVSADEGEKGWWNVTFDDGTEKKMRKADVAALGLLEYIEDE